MYDVTNIHSFDHVQEQFLEIDRYASNSVQRLLVGNKCDLVDIKVVDYPTSKEYADSIKVQLLETSAKCGTNVEQAFVMMASKIMRYIDETRVPFLDNTDPDKRVGIERSHCCC